MYYVHPSDPSRDSEQLHADAAHDHAAGLPHDMRACGTVHSGLHIIVKRESGQVAGWNFERYPERAQQFADECNALVPGNPAHVAMWDDSEWDALLAAGDGEVTS